MSFISTSAHHKFVSQCHTFIDFSRDSGSGIISNEEAEKLKADLAKLQELAEAYVNIISQLPELSREYFVLQRRMRIRLRKMQLEKTGTNVEKGK